ncbi:hypothetical protein ANTRET_LOCUS8037 [Anthophora retusa]
MYEPVILQKRKPLNIAGTPSFTVSIISSVAVVCVSVISSYYYSYTLHKQNKLIAELDERDVNNRPLTLYQELRQAVHLWERPVFHGAIRIAYQKLEEKRKSTTSVKSSSSESDIPKANN